MPRKKNSKSVIKQVQTNSQTPIERVFLTTFALFLSLFSLFPLLSPDVFADFLGFNRSDQFIYRVLGAAGFSYCVILIIALYRSISWSKMQYVMASFLVISLGSLYACIRAFLRPQDPQYVIFIVLIFSLILLFVTTKQLVQLRIIATGKTNLSSFTTFLVLLLSIVLVGCGLIVEIPRILFALVGVTGTDAFIYRLAGAYLAGLASLGFFVAIYRRFEHSQMPLFIYSIFFPLLFLISLIEMARTLELVKYGIFAIVALLFSILLIFALRKEGK